MERYVVREGYKIYSTGKVLNKKGKEIGSRHPCGYVILSIGGVRTERSRLVAEAFIPNPLNLPFVDHINHKRWDDRVENLRWVNESQNQRNRIKPEEMTTEIWEVLKKGRENSNRYRKRKKQKIADAKYEEYPRIIEFEKVTV